MAETGEDRPSSNWHLATREHVQLVTSVKLRLEEYYLLTGSFPSVAWLLEQLGLRP